MTTGVEKVGVFGRIRIMFLQWVLVKILANYNQKNGVNFTRMMFLGYLMTRKCLVYFRDIPRLKVDERLASRIDEALGDCIRGDLSYMSEADDGERLLVTAKGRKFISFWFLGLLEELTKSYPYAIGIIVASGIVGFLSGRMIEIISNLI